MSKKEIAVLGVLAAFAVALLIVLLTRGQEIVVTEFTPPPFDAAAQSGPPAVPQELTALYGTLELAEGISVSLCSSVNVHGGCAEVWFTAHGENTAWVRLRILDEKGEVLGESGLLRPGEYVASITLNVEPERSGPAQIRILTYEPETYYSLGTAGASITLRLTE